MNTSDTSSLQPARGTAGRVRRVAPARKIVVSRYAARVLVSASGEPAGAIARVRVRQRWQAQYLEGGTVRASVDSHVTFDDAIGALIRQMAQGCRSVDDVLDFVAGLFSDLKARTPDASLSRAVWIAARSKKRRHAGIAVEFPPEMEFSGEDKASISAPVKGGAA